MIFFSSLHLPTKREKKTMETCSDDFSLLVNSSQDTISLDEMDVMSIMKTIEFESNRTEVVENMDHFAKFCTLESLGQFANNLARRKVANRTITSEEYDMLSKRICTLKENIMQRKAEIKDDSNKEKEVQKLLNKKARIQKRKREEEEREKEKEEEEEANQPINNADYFIDTRKVTLKELVQENYIDPDSNLETRFYDKKNERVVVENAKLNGEGQIVYKKNDQIIYFSNPYAWLLFLNDDMPLKENAWLRIYVNNGYRLSYYKKRYVTNRRLLLGIEKGNHEMKSKFIRRRYMKDELQWILDNYQLSNIKLPSSYQQMVTPQS